MMGRLARLLGAALVVASAALVLGGCVGDATDEGEDVVQASAPVTVQPTPKVLSNMHQQDNNAPPPLDPVLSNGNNPADPQPQPWNPQDQNQNQGSGNQGNGSRPQLR